MANVEIYNGTEWVEIAYRNLKYSYSDKSFGDAIIVSDFSQVSSFDGDEELRIIDGSTLLFGGYLTDLGETEDDGRLMLEVFGYGSEIADEEIELDFSGTSTTDVDIMEETLVGTEYEGNLVFPSGASAIGVTGYTNKDTRKRVWAEITSNYNRRLFFLPDKTVRYEPVGFYDSTETIDTSATASRIKKWKKNITEYKINKVQVIGHDISGNVVDVVESESPANKFKRINVGYPISTSQASEIASANINNIAVDKGIVKVFEYKDVLVNETISIVDTKRGVDDDFVIKRQTNYFPEQSTELEVGMVDEEIGIEEVSRERRELRAERAKLLASKTKDVGNQFISDNTDNDDADISTSENNKSPDVEGFTGTQSLITSLESGGLTINLPTNSGWVDIDTVGISADSEFLMVDVTLEGSGGGPTQLFMRIRTLGENHVIQEVQSNFGSGSEFRQTFIIPIGSNISTDVTLELLNAGSSNSVGVSGEFVVYSEKRNHTHDQGTYNAINHRHDVSSSDSGHNHSYSGDTAEKNITVGDVNISDR